MRVDIGEAQGGGGHALVMAMRMVMRMGGEGDLDPADDSDDGVNRVGLRQWDAALHADEIPGLLVLNKLVKDLDELEAEGKICKKIVVLPYANPIGLQQDMLGSHIGRFNFATGVNFNRDADSLIGASAAFVSFRDWRSCGVSEEVEWIAASRQTREFRRKGSCR